MKNNFKGEFYMGRKLLPYTMEKVFKANEIQDNIPEGVKLIHAPKVWEDTKGKDVVVATIDTEIDKTHPDLKDRIIDGKDFTGTGDYQDDQGHGTHVAGTILASLNNSGVIGVAPSAKILALKALDAQGRGESSWINNALEYAIEWEGEDGEKVDIISMSLGGPDDEEEHQLIKKAVQSNILVVCASGNNGDRNPDTDEVAYPGAYPEVVEIGAVDFNKNIANFSNTNKEVDLVAPGVDIISTYPGGDFAKMSGTSMATPHVSGSAALVKKLAEKELGRKPSEEELRKELYKYVEDLNVDRNAQGNGLVDLTAVRSQKEQ